MLQETSGDGHDAVIEAIAARDAGHARRAMDDHIRTAWQEILDAIGGEPPSPATVADVNKKAGP